MSENHVLFGRSLPLFIVDESHSKNNNSCCTTEFGSINFCVFFRIIQHYLFVDFSFLIIDVFMVFWFHVSTICTVLDICCTYRLIILFLRTQKSKKKIELSATQFHFYILYSTEQNEVHTSIVFFSYLIFCWQFTFV